MASGHKIQQSRRRIFSSVFPSSPLASELPTPVATPDPSFLAPGQAFGVIPGDHGPSATHPSLNIASERTKWNRAWHTVTSFLILPREVIDAALDSSQIRKRWLKRASLEVSTCLEVLVSPFAAVNTASDGDSKDSIVEWYLNEVRRHYLAFVRPNLLIDHPADYDPEHKLSGILETLQLAQHIYLHPLIDHILPALSNPAGRTSNWSMTSRNASEIEARFRRDLQAIIVYSLPADQISSIFGDILTKECSVVLGITNAPNDEEPSNYKARDEESGTDQRMSAGDDNTLEGDNKTTQRFQGAEVSLNAEHVRAAREKILYTFQVLENVGLGQERGQRVFAEVMNKLMSEHVRTAYSEQWEAPSQVTENLKDWIENHYARLVVEVLHCLQPREQGVELSQSTRSVTGEELVCFDDVQKWQDMGIGRLGRLRVKQLFDIVVDWDASLGAVEDLKTYITTPATRTYLTTSFTSSLFQRLLHPGASTVEILQAYICLIRSFDMLDPRGVLLDRVARPIRRYLRDRDDTVKVIVTGLLADVEKEDETQPPGGEILTELAIELSRASDRAAQSAEDDGDLDWDDLEWVPDPIDAGPDYKKSKGSDVVGSLISLFDTKDVFIKEFQNVMGERLLKREFNLEKEVRLLELLKLRFGEGALQACEVMLRDVRESKVIDRNIQDGMNLPQLGSDIQTPRTGPPATPKLHAKILSHLFWPELHEGSFHVPDKIVELQERYEKGFEHLKQSRKLTWLQALGQVNVELEFDDRSNVVVEEVQTWQASVIYAFQDSDDVSGDTVTRTVSQLITQLEMDEGLVRNALVFWVGKFVLREIRKDEFTVLETRDAAEMGGNSQGARQAAVAAAEASASVAAEMSTSVKSADEVATDKLKMYWQFIVGMLTNGGAMPLQQIVMMLKFTVTGGFPFSDEDLREFLRKMVAEGNLEMTGDRYKIRQ